MKLFYEWNHNGEWKPCLTDDGYEIQTVGEIDTYNMDFIMSYRRSGTELGLCCSVGTKLRWYIDSMENDYRIINDASDLIQFRSLVEARMLEDILNGHV